MRPSANGIPPALRKAVLDYLNDHLEAAEISMTEAVRAAREAAPGFEDVSSQELMDFIAEVAFEIGFGVFFHH
jgi:hypothetical protein